MVGSIAFKIVSRYAVNRLGKGRWSGTYRRLRGVRTNRFKLTKKKRLRENLQRDPKIRQAMLDHADLTGESLTEAEARVQVYLEEIIPAFDLVSYYQLGLPISGAAVRSVYKHQVWKDAVPDPKKLHREAAVVYVFNHRSNADFVFASFALHEQVQLSYAVGEWARVWPLEKLFKSFGSYFVRRGEKVKLYHKVLRRYVQTITKNGVTQGIFIEGGLSRDGHFRPANVGLVDALLQVLHDEDFERDLVFVPAAINFDRVLEDRSLVSESLGKRRERSLWRMFRKTFRILFKNTLKLAFRRIRKHGYAALRLGAPISFRGYLEEHGRAAIEGERADRGPHVQAFGDFLLERIKEIMPVNAVPLACLALERIEFRGLDADLEDEVEGLRHAIESAGGCCVRGDKLPEEMARYAVVLLETRGLLVRDEAGGLSVPEHERPLVRYYARSIAHLLPEETPARFERSIM